MKAHILKGSKQEIAERVAGMSGEVREAIIFVDEAPEPAEVQGGNGTVDLFVEMDPFTVNVRDVDDSREAMYRRMEGE